MTNDTKLNERLETLRHEYEAGKRMLAELDAKRANLTTTLLRIEGAIEVLQELVSAPDSAAAKLELVGK